VDNCTRGEGPVEACNIEGEVVQSTSRKRARSGCFTSQKIAKVGKEKSGCEEGREGDETRKKAVDEGNGYHRQRSERASERKRKKDRHGKARLRKIKEAG